MATTQSAYNKKADKGFDPTKWMSGMQKSARKNAKSKKKRKYAWEGDEANLLPTASNLQNFIKGRDAAGSGPGTVNYVTPLTGTGRPALGTTPYGASTGFGAGTNLTPIAAAVTPRTDIPSVPWTPGGQPGAGGGGGNNAPGEVPMDEWTGWAAKSGFDADMLPTLYAQPDLISRQWLKERGWSPSSGRMESMGDIAGLLQMWSAATQGMGGVNTGNPDDFLNFADQIFQGMMDPGGKGVPDFNQMIANILDAPEGSALKAFMEGGDFNKQAGAFSDLIGAAAALKTPWMRMAIDNMLNEKTDEWMLANTRGRKDANGIADWFQKGGGGFFG